MPWSLVDLAVYAIGIPLGYLVELIGAYLYVAWTACRRSPLKVLRDPENLAFTVTVIGLLAPLAYYKPGMPLLMGMITGIAFRFGVDYGEWFQRLDEIRESCLEDREEGGEESEDGEDQGGDSWRQTLKCIEKARRILEENLEGYARYGTPGILVLFNGEMRPTFVKTVSYSHGDLVLEGPVCNPWELQYGVESGDWDD